MKKQFTLFAATTLAAMTVVPMVGFADSEEPVVPATQTYTSNGYVSFFQSDKPTKPVNPNNPNPNNPVTPKNPDGTNPKEGNNGPLSLDFASSLDFGKQKITSEDEHYIATAQFLQKVTDPNQMNDENKIDQNVPDYVQLTDNRGTFEGWTLKLKQDAQFKVNGDGAELTGATISFGNPNHKTLTAFAKDAKDPITTIKDFELTPGTELNIMAADASNAKGTPNGTGGTHVLRFGTESNIVKSDDATSKLTAQGNKAADNDKNYRAFLDNAIKLNVPGTSDKVANQVYKTTFTWTLANTPGKVSDTSNTDATK